MRALRKWTFNRIVWLSLNFLSFFPSFKSITNTIFLNNLWLLFGAKIGSQDKDTWEVRGWKKQPSFYFEICFVLFEFDFTIPVLQIHTDNSIESLERRQEIANLGRKFKANKQNCSKPSQPVFCMAMFDPDCFHTLFWTSNACVYIWHAVFFFLLCRYILQFIYLFS